MSPLDLSVRAPLGPRPAIADRTTTATALLVSICVHLALVSGWITLQIPALGGRGEDGREGGGGATFEVSVQGPEADEPIHMPTSPSVPSSESAPSEPRAPVARPSRRVLPTTDEGTEPSTSTSSDRASASSATTPTLAAQGTGAESTDSGRLGGLDDARLRALLSGSVGGALGESSLGNVAILEEASRCPDPVAGTWTAHRYSPEFRDWARFTLSITRHGDDLRGTIRTRMWRGMASDTRPPPCTPGGWDYTVEMTAHGSVHDESFDFGATEHHIARVECASPTFGYNPDHFSGTFDVERDMLHTTNNDGGRDVNAAYNFRRSSCQP